MSLRRVVGIRHRAGACAALRLPLVRTGRALRQFPFVFEQDPQEVVAPFRGRIGPGDLQAACYRVPAFAGAEAALPAEALLLDGGCFRLRPHMGRRSGAVSLAKGVSASDECYRLFVVHCHAGEGLADIPRSCDRIRDTVRAFRIDVDQPHLHGSERIFEVPVARVAFVIQPRALRTPVHGFFRLPDIRTAAGEAKGFESHRLQGDVARKNHEVGP